jgi:glycosyltransferase involved in cell wall biosynthesis
VVSIIVPNYNHSKYLNERLNSIISQKFSNFECILLDDASADNSVEILKQYIPKDSRLKIFINKVNSGSTFSQWNYGISKASGKYIWIAESDDIADHSFLDTMVGILEANSELSLVYSQSMLIDESGYLLGNWNFKEEIFKSSFKMKGVDFIYNYLIHNNYIPNASAVLFKKEDFISVGKSIEGLKNNGDWNLWLKILTKGDVCFVCNTLNYFRQHKKSVTAKAKVNLVFENKFDTRITELRNEYNIFLNELNSPTAKKIFKKNRIIIANEWGNYGLHLAKNKRYIHSLYYIVKATFYPNFKSYYIKKFFFGSFYNCLFKK